MRVLFGSGLWSRVMNKKYLKGVDVIFWLRSKVYKYHVASNLWKHLLGSLSILK